MCVNDPDEIFNESIEFLHTQMENSTLIGSVDQISLGNSFPLESISEDKTAVEGQLNTATKFSPTLRSGEWSHIGERSKMEDTHIIISDLAKKFNSNLICQEAISFYGVFDGHGGKDAAQFVRDHLPRIIVEDANFPLELEKVMMRSFVETDAAFAKSCSLDSALSSGTTALTAMIFGRSLLVANAGDCRAVLSRCGLAIEMSKDHRPCCNRERMRIESMGGYVDDVYLNGELAVTRALGDWHLKGMKEKSSGHSGRDNDGGSGGWGPLSAEPELKLITLRKEDEFLIICSDGIWDVFTSQNAVDYVRRRLRQHNDMKLCCKEVVEEAARRGATDNVTVLLVSFHMDPPPGLRPPKAVAGRKGMVRRSISAEGLQNLKCLLEG